MTDVTLIKLQPQQQNPNNCPNLLSKNKERPIGREWNRKIYELNS